MPVLIFKTNLKTADEVRQIQPLFNLHPSIQNWNVDTDDIDNILRIQSYQNISEKDVMQLLKQYGIYSEILV